MYSHVLAAFWGNVWAITTEKWEAMRAFLDAKATGQDIAAEQIAAVVGSRRPDGVQMVGRVAVLPVFGAIAQRVGMMERASGGVSAEEIGSTLDSLVADRAVKSIVMAFDSPGGSVFGVQELADKIRANRDRKRIVGIADSVAGSAAYWLLSQTSEVNVTPSGQVGSIGVIAAHTDESKSEEMKGAKTTLITAGKYKGEGSPLAPLSDEARAAIQGRVDYYYGQFVGSVAKGRGVSEARVEKDMGQGRMMTAKAALAAGMVDHIATLETVLKRLGADAQASNNYAAMAANAAARARAISLVD